MSTNLELLVANLLDNYDNTKTYIIDGVCVLSSRYEYDDEQFFYRGGDTVHIHEYGMSEPIGAIASAIVKHTDCAKYGIVRNTKECIGLIIIVDDKDPLYLILFKSLSMSSNGGLLPGMRGKVGTCEFDTDTVNDNYFELIRQYQFYLPHDIVTAVANHNASTVLTMLELVAQAADHILIGAYVEENTSAIIMIFSNEHSQWIKVTLSGCNDGVISRASEAIVHIAASKLNNYDIGYYGSLYNSELNKNNVYVAAEYSYEIGSVHGDDVINTDSNCGYIINSIVKEAKLNDGGLVRSNDDYTIVSIPGKDRIVISAIAYDSTVLGTRVLPITQIGVPTVISLEHAAYEVTMVREFGNVSGGPTALVSLLLLSKEHRDIVLNFNSSFVNAVLHCWEIKEEGGPLVVYFNVGVDEKLILTIKPSNTGEGTYPILPTEQGASNDTTVTQHVNMLTFDKELDYKSIHDLIKIMGFTGSKTMSVKSPLYLLEISISDTLTIDIGEEESQYLIGLYATLDSHYMRLTNMSCSKQAFNYCGSVLSFNLKEYM